MDNYGRDVILSALRFRIVYLEAHEMGLTYGKLSSVPEYQRMQALRSVQKELMEARQVLSEVENLRAK